MRLFENKRWVLIAVLLAGAATASRIYEWYSRPTIASHVASSFNHGFHLPSKYIAGWLSTAPIWPSFPSTEEEGMSLVYSRVSATFHHSTFFVVVAIQWLWLRVWWLTFLRRRRLGDVATWFAVFVTAFAGLLMLPFAANVIRWLGDTSFWWKYPWPWVVRIAEWCAVFLPSGWSVFFLVTGLVVGHRGWKELSRESEKWAVISAICALLSGYFFVVMEVTFRYWFALTWPQPSAFHKTLAFHIAVLFGVLAAAGGGIALLRSTQGR